MNKSDLEKLVEIRLLEAETLLKSGNFQGAYYLVGYSLECALKACIAKQVNQYDFPNKQLANQSHTHNLTELLGVAGLKQKLSEKEKEDTDFGINWAVAKDWSESSRYECNIEETRARDLINAVTEINSGILAWLKTYW
ncbi:HEPN domain-containing protein [Methylobacter sp. S3L5C]|uniref:HEPN domain-containing protein n=1 Tax=Methylobacter sp. S3L5C TaxID=2839024 RepID=UPI001FAE304F|nr:HEPN domain-containing protein [Methylobacter sp. S3L5C]UOA08801.1 HEPN domain-containing protein [Methylobacter sp. S3L5C]